MPTGPGGNSFTVASARHVNPVLTTQAADVSNAIAASVAQVLH
jgi:hypothetical protein